ncbi:hypothetical protein L3Q82_003170 [Scortum barcoo]|uniref:Uncharacterized protein n=1 Tax=Scortum barcoo TaxID=214431 RepID=A0ACB8VRN6_9TELE|nr:hypothetical protein L3Q82_003170 [Scortum barcoo]
MEEVRLAVGEVVGHSSGVKSATKMNSVVVVLFLDQVEKVNRVIETDLPSVSLLQKSPSSPVSCHATGFYPDRATLIWRKDGEELHEDVDHGEILPNHDGSFQMSVDLKLSSVTPEDWSRYDCVFHLSGVKDDIVVTKLDKAEIRTNWEKSSDLTFPIVAAVVVLVLVLIAAAGFTVNKRQKVKHSLKFFFTASSGGPGYQLVGSSEVDGTVAGRCDGVQKLAEVKQGWMQKIFEDDPQHWAHYTRECFEVSMFYRGYMDVSGTMRLKMINGINQLTPSNWSWDADKSRIKYNEVVLTQICPQWLKKYLTFGKSSLLRTDLPSVSLLQKSPSSPVSCHATGFYPDRATLIWRKDGEELHEDVDHGEILPNHDGSFQMSVDLKLSSVTPEDWSRYDCVFHLSGVKDDIVTKLDKAEIRTNWDSPSESPAAAVIGVVVGLLLLALCIAGLFIWKRNNKGFRPANSSDSSSSSSDKNSDSS